MFTMCLYLYGNCYQCLINFNKKKINFKLTIGLSGSRKYSLGANLIQFQKSTTSFCYYQSILLDIFKKKSFFDFMDQLKIISNLVVKSTTMTAIVGKVLWKNSLICQDDEKLNTSNTYYFSIFDIEKKNFSIFSGEKRLNMKRSSFSKFLLSCSYRVESLSHSSGFTLRLGGSSHS